MGTDSNLRRQLDELLQAGEKAAALFDGAGLDQVSQRLAQWEAKFEAAEPDKEFLLYVRDKISRYRDVCGFFAQTMYATLVYASQCNEDAATEAGSKYSKEGTKEPSSVQPILMKTYG